MINIEIINMIEILDYALHPLKHNLTTGE